MSRVATGWIPAKLGDTGVISDGAKDGEGPSPIIDDVLAVSDTELVGVEVSLWMPMNSQQAVNEEAATWTGVWQRGIGEHSPKWPEDLGMQLPPMTVPCFREAGTTFSNGVGLGWDKLHPRAIARCSETVISALLQLLLLAELLGRLGSALS